MADYTKTTNFLAKDSLPLNNAAKYVKGSEIDTEFNNIATADADNLKISALGTGIETALEVNTGSAGAPALLGSAASFTTISASGVITGAAATNLTLNSVSGQNVYVTINGVTVGAFSVSGFNTGSLQLTAAQGTEAAPAIVGAVGTADTGMWFPAADTVAFSTAGVERVRWASTGEQTQKANATSGITNKYNGRTSDDYGVQYFYNFDGTTNQFNFSWAPTESRFTNVNGVTTFYAGVTERLRIDTSGNVLLTSATLLGYGTGAGGTVTQDTNRTTTVVINKPCGTITLFSAAGSTSWQSFTVSNSLVAATDTIIVNQKSGTDLNEIHVTAVGAGSFRISFRTTSGTTTEQPVFNFAVIKAVTS